MKDARRILASIPSDYMGVVAEQPPPYNPTEAQVW